MLRRLVRDSADWVSRVIHHPREELTHWQATARFWYDLARVGGKRLQEDRALQMAAALAFHTLFALMPLAIVSTALFKGMQGVDKLQSLVHQLVQTAGLDAVRIMPADASGDQGMSVGTWLEEMISRFGTIDLETLGLVGLAGMIYASVAMLVTVEDCFNTIYRAPQGRSWLRRMPIYWTVLTVGPIGIALLLVVDGHVGRWIASVEARAGLIHVLGIIWSVGIITVMLLGTFVLLPNTHVSWRSAIGGALVSAVLLHIGKVGLAAYVNNAFSFSHLYGPLGFVPVLMLWTYAMWICILFGVEGGVGCEHGGYVGLNVQAAHLQPAMQGACQVRRSRTAHINQALGSLLSFRSWGICPGWAKCPTHSRPPWASGPAAAGVAPHRDNPAHEHA
jgi:membrane protein